VGQTVTVDGRSLAVQSQNYYMLTRERPINSLHWLAPDDTHILIEGGPVDYFIFHPDGQAEKVTLGMDLAAGQRPVVAVPGGCWKALRLREGVGYALVANTLSPEFTPDRVKIGAGAAWVKRCGVCGMGDSGGVAGDDWSELGDRVAASQEASSCAGRVTGADWGVMRWSSQVRWAALMMSSNRRFSLRVWVVGGVFHGS